MSEFWLMNKNTKIALIEYDEHIPGITMIKDIINIEYAPLNIYKAYKQKDKNLLRELNNWFRGRGIPSWRDELDRMLMKLHVSAPEELLTKAFGLSLSDQYWICPLDSGIEWKNINFFTNDFEIADYTNATFGDSSSRKKINLYSPNNTTDGMLKKAWIIEEGKRVLVKGGFRNRKQEPLNECLASMICDALGFDHVIYEIGLVENQIVSKCPCFIDEHHELIPANAIFESKRKSNNVNDYEHYISILEDYGIAEARTQLENMFILDYLVMNVDRHLRNFGVIRNVETLEWERVAPIFDTGQSMNSQSEMIDMNFNRGKGKFFSNIDKPFDDYLSIISDPYRFDCSKLETVKERWREILEEYQAYTGMTEEKIQRLIDGLELRIKKFDLYLEKVKK